MCDAGNHKFICVLKKSTPPTVKELNSLDADLAHDTSSTLGEIIEALTTNEYVIICEKCGISQEEIG